MKTDIRIHNKALHLTEQKLKGIMEHNKEKVISGVQGCLKNQCPSSYQQTEEEN